jgi:hypothetical protein
MASAAPRPSPEVLLSERYPMLRRLLSWWPEAQRLVITAAELLEDGLRSSSGDPAYYLKISEQVSQGMIPWRDFPFEYPPISLPPVLLPYFLPGGTSWEGYTRGLFSENVLLLLAIGAGVAWLASRGWTHVSLPRATLMYTALAISLAPVVVWRYDAVPTLLTVLAVVAITYNRAALAGIGMGAAIVGKLYPIVMLPAMFIGLIRNGRLRPSFALIGTTIATSLLILLPFVAIAGVGAFSWLEYAVARSVQIESVPGGIALLANVLGGPESRIYHGFGTWQVDSPLIPMLGTMWTAFTVVMVLALAVAIFHRYRIERASGGLVPTTMVTQLLAALMVVLVSARVLSPQYLFWAVPFVALVSRPKTLFFWATCLVTTFVYPNNYQELLNQEAYTIWAVNLRNLMLVVFTVWVITPDVVGAISSLRTRQSTATAPSR